MRTAMTTVVTDMGAITGIRVTVCALQPFRPMPEKNFGVPVGCRGNTGA
jgi:hypothetical protein